MFVSIERLVDEKANLDVSKGDAMVEVADLNRPFSLQCPLCLSKKMRRSFEAVREAAGSQERKVSCRMEHCIRMDFWKEWVFHCLSKASC